MKITKKVPGFILLFSLIFISCEKEDDNTKDEINKGQVLFYTNAQALLNCGEFDVNIYIDNAFVGKLNQSYLSIDSMPSSEIDDTEKILKLEMDNGAYSYSADYNCGGNHQWTGNFEVENDSCTKILLNASADERDFKFLAKVTGRGMDCGDTYIIVFDTLNNPIMEDTEWFIHPFRAYYAFNLPEKCKIPDQMIKLNCRKPKIEELRACTCLGPSVPPIIVTDCELID